MNTSREIEARENARRIAGGNLLLAARMNEQEARLWRKEWSKEWEEKAKEHMRLARAQRQMLKEAKGL